MGAKGRTRLRLRAILCSAALACLAQSSARADTVQVDLSSYFNFQAGQFAGSGLPMVSQQLATLATHWRANHSSFRQVRRTTFG